MTRQLPPMLAALAALACVPEPAHLPGDVKDVRVVVKLAELSSAEVNGIGSFSLTPVHDGAALAPIPVNWSASARTLTFLEEPTSLPTTGRLAVRLRAHDVAGNALAIGGGAGPIDLDALPVGAVAELLVVVGRLEAPTSLGQLARPRARATVSATSSGLLVFGGEDQDGLLAAPDFLHLAQGRQCTADATGEGCVFGEVPPARAAHVALTLADGFDPSCPYRDAVFLGFGEAIGGAALGDAWLFEPAGLDGAGAFSAIATPASPRVAPWAVALRSCDVLVGGGRDGVIVDGVEVFHFGADAITHQALPDGIAGAGAAVIATRNALDEVVVAGGVDGAGVATDAAYLLSYAAPELSLCGLADGSCNGAAAAFCGGAEVSVARIDDGSDLAPALSLRGCGDPQVFRSASAPPFAAFVPLAASGALTAREGAAVLPFGPGRAVVLGGRVAGEPVAAVEAFTLTSVDDDGATGSFGALAPLATARTEAALGAMGDGVVVAGGRGGDDAPSGAVEILIPSFE
ncbi:MAG: hypothetical protein HYS27_28630 [Deltaproteobacteria bacterium]|nr:hypothetical protein [Deltaproteobacteria bacterium]